MRSRTPQQASGMAQNFHFVALMRSGAYETLGCPTERAFTHDFPQPKHLLRAPREPALGARSGLCRRKSCSLHIKAFSMHALGLGQLSNLACQLITENNNILHHSTIRCVGA